MIWRASPRDGTPASIAAIVTVSAFVSRSRPIVMRRATVLADGIRRSFRASAFSALRLRVAHSLTTRSEPMSKNSAFWIAFFSSFLASGLALRVAFSLGLVQKTGELMPTTELANQSKWAAIAALAALVSAIAQIIERASK